MKHFLIYPRLAVLLLSCWWSAAVSAQIAPTWTRTTQIGSTALDQVHHTVTDASGNTYQTGIFSATMQCGSLTLTKNSMSSYDMYLVKSDPQGNVVWARQAGTTANAAAYGAADANKLALDAAGNVYVAGSFVGTASFGGTATTLTTPANKFSAFIAKYTPQGTVAWVQQATTTGTGFSVGLALATNGDVFVSGSFTNTIAFGSTTFSSLNNSLDIFLVRYSATGTLQWVKTAGGPADDYGGELVPAPGDGVYLSGTFTTSITLGSTASATGYGNTDCFLAQYDAQGVAQWATAWGGPGTDFLRALALAPDGTLYAAGYFTGTASFSSLSLTSAGGYDGFLLRCSAQGSPTWVQQLGGANDDYATALVLHPAGVLYVAGRFSGTTTVAQQSLISAGGYDVFLARYSSAGTGIWAVRGGGPLDEKEGGVAYSSGGTVKLGVEFSGTAQFGSTTLTSLGQSDVALCQLQDNTALATHSGITASFTMHPNPATQVINLDNLPVTSQRVQVNTLTGQIVLSRELIQLERQQHICVLDINSLSAGNYTLQITTEEGVISKQITISK